MSALTNRWQVFSSVSIGIGSLLILVTVLESLPPHSPLLPSIDDLSLTISDVDVLSEKQLPIFVSNPNHKAIRIVGCKGNGCGPGGCVYGIEPEAFEIAPGETKEIFVRYKSPPIPGPFEKEFSIFSATNTLNEHKLKVTGVAVAAKKKEIDHPVSKGAKENSEEKSHASGQDS